jgi:arginase
MWRAGKRLVFAAHEQIYLSLDLDGLDPAFAPGVSHPEPAGSRYARRWPSSTTSS